MTNHVRRALVGVGMAALCVLLAGCAPAEGSVDLVPSAGSSSSEPSSDGPSSKPTPSPAPSREASATIVIAGVDVDGLHVTASGSVDGVIENGGKCSFVFTGSGDPVTVDSTGTADSSNTSCGSVKAPTDSFTPGTWSVVLNYSSKSITVASVPQTLEIS